MIVVLSTADTDLLALRRAVDAARDTGNPLPELVALNAAAPGAAERAVAVVLECAAGDTAVVLRLHGGLGACPGAEALLAAGRQQRAPVVALAAAGVQDAELRAASSAPEDVCARAAAYLDHGGVANAGALLRYLSDSLLRTSYGAPAPATQPADGVYLPAGAQAPGAGDGANRATRPTVGIVFYRSHWLSGNLGFVDALVRAVERRGCAALPVFCGSLRPAADKETPYVLERYFLDADGQPLVDVLVSTLSFAAARLGTPGADGLEEATEATGEASAWLERLGVPVLQALVCTESRAAWEARATGLGPLDVAMQVALPEFDGRIITLPVCFKETLPDASVAGAVYVPDEERCDALAAQAAAWARLRRTPNAEKRVAVVLGNYPARNGRMGNAVALDTPASLVALLRALRGAGYLVGNFPEDGDALMHRLADAGTYDPDFGSVGEWTPEGGPPGLRFGNVFVGLQPPRGWGDDPDAVYHDPELPPPAAYAAFYRWLRDPAPRGFGAHAVVHLGKHGTLEWLPGKAVGLSRDCTPDALLGELPLVYPFVVNDPGEGTQAKRRAHAVLVGHLVPPLAEAGTDGALTELASLERLIQQERAARVTHPEGVPALRTHILEAVREARLEEELGLVGDNGANLDHLLASSDLERLLDRLERYLDELQHATIRDGLHVLGQAPVGEARERLLEAMVRLAPVERKATLMEQLAERLDRTGDELAAVLRALDGGYVPAGPSGSPSRGMWNVLPTGRNFYSVDPQAIPSSVAWETGQRLAAALLARHREETGDYPRTVGLVVWGTAAMRTHGDDVAQALALLGVRPTWQPETGRVTDIKAIALEELGRPRVDVTLHISGFFRDAFPHLVTLLDRAVRLVAGLDEPDEWNPVAAHVRHEAARLAAAGTDETEARRQAGFRIFGSKPGCYGVGILPLIDARNWRTREDLARAYETWSSYAYGQATPGVPARGAFRARFGAIEAAAKNGDTVEHDLFDSDDYFQYHGGMIATATALRGEAPRAYFGDSADPMAPAMRTLDEQTRRVFRSRVANPRWLAAMRRHGYKGAFEMAATVDYLFGYDATASVASDWMYERMAQAYVLDPEQRAFFARSNPWALRDVAERLLEAAARGLWEHPGPETLDDLRRAYLEADGDVEGRVK